MSAGHYPDHVGCEATWVLATINVVGVDGIEKACEEPATCLTTFEDEKLLVCDQCAADLAGLRTVLRRTRRPGAHWRPGGAGVIGGPLR